MIVSRTVDAAAQTPVIVLSDGTVLYPTKKCSCKNKKVDASTIEPQMLNKIKRALYELGRAPPGGWPCLCKVKPAAPPPVAKTSIGTFQKYIGI